MPQWVVGAWFRNLDGAGNSERRSRSSAPFENRPVDWNRLIPGTFVSCTAAPSSRRFSFGRRAISDRRPRLDPHVRSARTLCRGLPAQFCGRVDTMVYGLGTVFRPGAVDVIGFISEKIAFWCMAAAIHAIEFQRRVGSASCCPPGFSARLFTGPAQRPHVPAPSPFLFNTLQGISTASSIAIPRPPTRCCATAHLLRKTSMEGPS